ncbi:hypothetical protein [Chitinimonas sp.]|uniref:hypothetical protein n=1 Tax=Chitinimonas sp. TaxID=1934313 RepID=UPI0035B115E0
MNIASAGSNGFASSNLQSGKPAARLAVLQGQIDILQRKYADICGCQTTPRDEKLKEETRLSQQMAALQAQIETLKQASRPAPSDGPAGEVRPTPARQTGHNVAAIIDIRA